MNFSGTSLMRTWHRAGFRIELHDSSRPATGAHSWLGYRLLDDDWAHLSGAEALIFAGDDLRIAGIAIDSLAAIQVVGRFLSCRPGDVDQGYFRTYTPAQIAWRDARAEDLARCCTNEPPTRPARARGKERW